MSTSTFSDQKITKLIQPQIITQQIPKSATQKNPSEKTLSSSKSLQFQQTFVV